MPDLNLTFHDGHNSSQDRSRLKNGELQESIGAEYRDGNTDQIWTIKGRTEFDDTGSARKIKGVALCLFDTGGTDRLLALSETTLYSASSPGTTGTFSSLVTGLSNDASSLSAAHAINRWFLGNGQDRNLVLDSSGNTRNQGMFPPDLQPTATVDDTIGTPVRGDDNEDTGDWTNPHNASDSAGGTTFAHATSSTAGSTTHVWPMTAGTTAATPISLHKLVVQYRLYFDPADVPDAPDASAARGTGVGVGGDEDPGATATAKVDVSWDGGDNYFELVNETLKSSMTKLINIHVAVPAGQLSENIYVRGILTYVTGITPATMQISDIQMIATPSTAADKTTSDGLYYGVTEYDEDDGIESMMGPQSAKVELSDSNNVSITLPGSANVKNSNTTHFRVYRNSDGGGSAKPAMGRIAQIPISVNSVSQTEYMDDFSVFDFDQQPFPPYAMIQQTSSQTSDDNPSGALYYDRDSPPPIFNHLNFYKGSVVGVSPTTPRTLYYSVPGMPDSYPSQYVISQFPMPEHDELVATATVGDAILIGAKGTVFSRDNLPLIVDGVFNAGANRSLGGHGGLVGPNAICVISDGEAELGAWVSPYGIMITDTHTVRRVTDDIKWKSELSQSDLSSSVLFYDPEDRRLIFAYNTDGTTSNNRYALIHLSPEHRKKNGQPRVTWGHYGQISDLTGGLISGVRRTYSGHVDDGSVYLEFNGRTDASNAYDSSGTILTRVKTGRHYDQSKLIKLVSGHLNHTNAGTGETCTVTVKTGRDYTETEQTRIKTVPVGKHGRSQFFVGLRGEWVECQVEYTGSGDLGMVELLLTGMKDAGRVGGASK